MDQFAAQLVTGKDEKEKFILSLIVKKEYNFNDNGLCVSGNEPPKFIDNYCYYENNAELLEDDFELIPFKLFTDIVIKGNAYNPDINTSNFQAVVQVADQLNTIQVIGNRKVFYNGTKLKFTDPENIEKIPLRYDYAYGGRDQGAVDNIPKLDEEYLKLLPKDIDLYGDTFYNYPRNPQGKGYVVESNKNFIETLELPNLEDCDDQLTPDNLIVGNLEMWHKMPLPRCTDWMPNSFFPRIAYTGLFENFLTPKYQLKEVLKGWADKSLFHSTRDNLFEFNYRFTNAASYGLQLPYIKRQEKIWLKNIHPRIKDFVLTLPKDSPSIWVDGRKGKLLETRPVIHAVVVKPDENKLSIIWRGSGPALRPYFPDELKTMPFKILWS